MLRKAGMPGPEGAVERTSSTGNLPVGLPCRTASSARGPGKRARSHPSTYSANLGALVCGGCRMVQTRTGLVVWLPAASSPSCHCRHQW